MAETERGQCRSCGVDLIDWSRVHQRNINDVSFTFTALKYELVRHHFWHRAIDQKALNHARRKGYSGLKDSVRTRLLKSIASESPPYDGRQTPYQGNIIFYAQHAVGCCCRTCIEYWHDIPKGTPLTEAQLVYFEELVMMYIHERLPDLTENGEKISYIRYGHSG